MTSELGHRLPGLTEHLLAAVLYEVLCKKYLYSEVFCNFCLDVCELEKKKSRYFMTAHDSAMFLVCI